MALSPLLCNPVTRNLWKAKRLAKIVETLTACDHLERDLPAGKVRHIVVSMQAEVLASRWQRDNLIAGTEKLDSTLWRAIASERSPLTL